MTTPGYSRGTEVNSFQRVPAFTRILGSWKKTSYAKFVLVELIHSSENRINGGPPVQRFWKVPILVSFVSIDFLQYFISKSFFFYFCNYLHKYEFLCTSNCNPCKKMHITINNWPLSYFMQSMQCLMQRWTKWMNFVITFKAQTILFSSILLIFY